jgi:phosphopantetheinyl transferase
MAAMGEVYSRDALVFWKKVWARLVFNHQERREFNSIGGSEQGQFDWLLARIAAKDAVRVFLKKHHGLSVYMADIEIAKDDGGRPEPRGYWQREIGYVPALSMSHGSYLGLAIAGRCAAGQRLGVDVQQLEARSPDFEGVAFTPQERSLLDGIGNPDRHEWLTRLWCAKEAVGKALCGGLLHGPHSVTVKALDPASGLVKVALGDRFTGEFPELAGGSMAVYTTRYRHFIIASTLCERA